MVETTRESYHMPVGVAATTTMMMLGVAATTTMMMLCVSARWREQASVRV